MKLSNYFNEENYYSPNILIKILEDYYGISYEEIKKDINSKQIVVGEDGIKYFLNNKFEEENPELKKRIENSRNNKQNRTRISLSELTKEDIKRSAQAFSDQIKASRYSFDPYTLQYFKKYSDIVRNKALSLISIIDSIVAGKVSSINEFDIVLSEDGKIAKTDIERLITPTLWNIDALYAKVNMANSFETYLNFSVSQHSLMRHGVSENEIYPTVKLQIRDLYYDGLKGNIPLSESQKEQLRIEQKANFDNICRLLSRD